MCIKHNACLVKQTITKMAMVVDFRGAQWYQWPVTVEPMVAPTVTVATVTAVSTVAMVGWIHGCGRWSP
jgi:hypothetical protein